MTHTVEQMSAERFAAIWNAAGTLDEAAAKVKLEVGTPCPRWAVMARAVALREQGVQLKVMPKMTGG